MVVATPFTRRPLMLPHAQAAKWDPRLREGWGDFFDLMSRLASGVTLFLDWTPASFEPLFWTAFGLVCLWYVLFSLPVVVGDMLRWERRDRVEDSRLWQLLARHLRVTLQLALVMQLLKPLGCTYDPLDEWALNTTAPHPPPPLVPPALPPPLAPPPPFTPLACFNSSAANGTAPPGASTDEGAWLAGWIAALVLAALFFLWACLCGQGEDDDCDPPNRTAIFVNVVGALGCLIGFAFLLREWLEDRAEASAARPVDCVYYPPWPPPPPPLSPPELPVRYAHLRANPAIACWDADSPQPMMALCGLLALAFFLLSAHVIASDSPLVRIQQSSALDVRYSELYVLVLNVGRLLLAGRTIRARSFVGPCRACDACDACHGVARSLFSRRAHRPPPSPSPSAFLPALQSPSTSSSTIPTSSRRYSSAAPRCSYCGHSCTGDS